MDRLGFVSSIFGKGQVRAFASIQAVSRAEGGKWPPAPCTARLSSTAVYVPCLNVQRRTASGNTKCRSLYVKTTGLTQDDEMLRRYSYTFKDKHASQYFKTNCSCDHFFGTDLSTDVRGTGLEVQGPSQQITSPLFRQLHVIGGPVMWCQAHDPNGAGRVRASSEANLRNLHGLLLFINACCC